VDTNEPEPRPKAQVYPKVIDGPRKASAAAQDHFVRQTGAILVLSGVAAFGGAVPWEVRAGDLDLDLLALAGAVAFMIGLIMSVLLLVIRPQDRWYQGRAAVESIKTLSWQYCVAGGSYPKGLADADAKLTRQITKVITELPAIKQPGRPLTTVAITPEMHGYRNAPLGERQDIYLADRIEDQMTWYSDNAEKRRRQSNIWLVVTISAQIVGTALAALKGFGIVDIDLLGIAAAIAAGGAAWSQTKQYQAQAASYTVASKELLLIHDDFQTQKAAADEAGWAEYVNDAETAISREHTTWRARSGIS
jgi:hypothetical protein